jgi:hypothetical protein
MSTQLQACIAAGLAYELEGDRINTGSLKLLHGTSSGPSSASANVMVQQSAVLQLAPRQRAQSSRIRMLCAAREAGTVFLVE